MFDQRLTRPHFKAAIFASYLELLEKEYPNVNISSLVEKTGFTLDYLRNEDHWVSVTFERRFMDLILAETGDTEVHLKAGQLGMSRSGLGEGLHFLTANIIPLDTIYRSLPKMTSLFNKVISVEIVESKAGHFKYLFKPNLQELNEEEAEILVSNMPFVMDNTRGYYGQIPTLKRMPPAHVAVEVVDPATGTYSLEVSYFGQSELVGRLYKGLPVPIFIFSAWAFHSLAHLDFNWSLLSAFATITSLVAIHFGLSNRRLRGISVQTEQSLYRLDAQNKDLYDAKIRLQRKLDESLVTYQLVTHLITATMEEEVLQLGCECLVDNLRYDRAFILLFDREANCLRLAASVGMTADLRAGLEGFTLPVDIGDDDPAKFSNVFRSREPLLVKDVKSHMAKLKDPTSLKVLQASGTHSFVAAPIATQNTSLGIFVADCVSKQKIMTEDDLQLISTAARQIAIGIEQQRSKQNLVESYQKEMELSESYARFVPFETLAMLNYRSISDVKIGDYVDTNVAIMFSDIRGFTTLCEHMTPNEILKFLNSYYGRLSPIIKTHGGTIDKFMGDGMMAVFPTAESALAAGIDIQRSILAHNFERLPNRVPIHAGVGIAAGRVVFGPLGSEKRLELTAIADTVNVASRLDSLCRDTGQNIMITGISDEEIAKFPHVLFTRWEPVKVKGRNGDVSVIAVSDDHLFSSLAPPSSLSEVQKRYLDEEMRQWQIRRSIKSAA